jgi:hypothetical protein
MKYSFLSSSVFQIHCSGTKAGVRDRYTATEQLAERGKPFKDAEFVKSCILATVEELCA